MSMKINQLAVSFKQHWKYELMGGGGGYVMKEQRYGKRQRENTEFTIV